MRTSDGFAARAVACFLVVFPTLASANLLNDGSFESSGTASVTPLDPSCWSSDLGYFIDNPGHYDVVNGASPNTVNAGWRSDLLAQSGSHYLLVDGSDTSADTILSSAGTISAVSGTTYTLSTYLARVDSNAEPFANLTFELSFFDAGGSLINSVQTTASPTSLQAGWQQISLTGIAGANVTQAGISVLDSMVSVSGNDFALDNFDLEAQAVPEPSMLLVCGLGVVAMLRRRVGKPGVRR